MASNKFDEAYPQSIGNGYRKVSWNANSTTSQQEEKKQEEDDEHRPPQAASPGETSSPLLFSSKIEERWARAQAMQDEMAILAEAERDMDSLYADEPFESSYRDSRRALANRNLLRHFKGCVQCLLE